MLVLTEIINVGVRGWHVLQWNGQYFRRTKVSNLTLLEISNLPNFSVFQATVCKEITEFFKILFVVESAENVSLLFARG